ncbi:MAG: DUF4838 domain-containing protein [Candidatus Omnitrophica bacterium]|nr:DUF4838 domain-containing protein [Candidatus Omnitrophota bacterium]
MLKNTIFLIIVVCLPLFICFSPEEAKPDNSNSSRVVLARAKQALLPVILEDRSIPAEVTAAQELCAYLKRISGADFQIAALPNADGRGIYVGNTSFARAHGIDPNQLGPEDSVIRTVDGSLIISGGRPRGTLYGVYDFLENVCGCRWYTAWSEKVPSISDLSVSDLDKHTHPYFMYRENYCHLGDVRSYSDHAGWTRFAVRNCVNIATPDPQWGDGVSRGRAGNHSFYLLVPTEKYFKDHPEYFSMRNGVRVPSTATNGNQLCLTNPDVLRIVIEEVRKDFQNYPNATYVSVSINDGGNATICDCPKCRAVAKKEGESGLLLQFVNAVADAVKKEYPGKYILTLAYNATSEPPLNIHARDNVIVFAAASGRSALVHFPRGMDSEEFQTLRGWSQFAPHLWAWDYANSIFRGMHFFCPLTWQMDDQFKFYKQLGNVDGLFQENEFIGDNGSLFPQFYEMNFWIFAHLARNPDTDLNVLINDFLEGYYGSAAPALRQYVDLVRSKLSQYPYRFFDYAFVSQAQSLFSQALSAVADKPELLGRVRDLRLQLDLATVAWRNDIIGSYLAAGGVWENYPFKLALITDRLKQTLAATENPLLMTKYSHWTSDGQLQFIPVSEGVSAFIQTYSSGKEYEPLPDIFCAIPRESIIDLIGPPLAWDDPDGPGLFLDSDAALGLAALKSGDQELPMPMATYTLIPKNLSSNQSIQRIKAADITGPGYHWYQGPRFTLHEWTYLYLTRSWKFQEHLWSEYDPANPNQEWDVYVSLKFTGGAYPFGKSDEPNAVHFDRIVLIKRNFQIDGDVSGDGKVTSYDAALTARYVVGLVTLTPDQIKKADISHDGKVSAWDAVLIARKALENNK